VLLERYSPFRGRRPRARTLDSRVLTLRAARVGTTRLRISSLSPPPSPHSVPQPGTGRLAFECEGPIHRRLPVCGIRVRCSGSAGTIFPNQGAEASAEGISVPGRLPTLRCRRRTALPGFARRAFGDAKPKQRGDLPPTGGGGLSTRPPRDRSIARVFDHHAPWEPADLPPSGSLVPRFFESAVSVRKSRLGRALEIRPPVSWLSLLRITRDIAQSGVAQSVGGAPFSPFLPRLPAILERNEALLVRTQRVQPALVRLPLRRYRGRYSPIRGRRPLGPRAQGEA
jgi:hypothetical protein